MKEKISVMMSQIRDLPGYANAGADEVIVAYQDYSLTALKQYNFEDIKVLKENSKDFQVEVGVLMNDLFASSRMEALKETLYKLASIQIKTIYYSDPSVLAIVQENDLPLDCVYMPDMLITSTAEAKAWLTLGAKEVVVSPLLTIEETKKFIDIEGAIIPLHGRFVMSKAGRRLLTSYQNNYKQPEVLTHKTTLTIRENKREDFMPIYEDERGTLIYNDYVLCSMRVTELLKGCRHFLINSVFSNRLETMEAVAAYRRILDGAKGSDVYQEFVQKFPEEKFSEGYYYDTTIQ